MKKRIFPILLACNIFLAGCSVAIPDTEVIKPNTETENTDIQEIVSDIKTEMSPENIIVENSTTGNNTTIKESENINSSIKKENTNNDINSEIINSDGVFDVNTACLLVDNLYENKNIMISPLSIYMALGMLTNGTDNETLTELEEFLGCSIEELNDISQNIINTNDNVLSIANGIWVKDDESIKVKENYIEKIKEFYNGTLKLSKMDFEALNEINNFVKTNTNGMIPNVINELSPDVISVLVNTLYFEALWASPYNEWQIIEGIFNNKNTIDYLIETGNSYMENDKSIGFRKDYQGGKYSFIGILPKKEGDFNLKDLDINSLIKSECFDYDVDTKLPKFEFNWDSKLNEVLQKMGLNKIFSEIESDFSGMFYEDSSIYVSDIIHKTKIELSESGTKAAAVTAIMLEKNAMILDPPERKEISLDRPFAFMIIDNENNIPLFIGKVVEL